MYDASLSLLLNIKECSLKIEQAPEMHLNSEAERTLTIEVTLPSLR